MSSLAEVISYMAMLSREGALHDLNDKHFCHPGNIINCSFGTTSEFYFVATGRPDVRHSMVDLAELYYDAGKLPKGYIVVEEASKSLASAREIGPFVKRGRSRWRFEDPDEPISFYVRGIEPDMKKFEPSHVDFSCLIDAKNYLAGGCLLYNDYIPAADSDLSNYIDRFVEFCQKIGVFYAVSGISLLYGTYSSANPGICYPIYKRFPGLNYADVTNFVLEIYKNDNVIRDVNWLTAVGASVLAKHPAIAQAVETPPPEVKVHRYDGGIVLQAGPRPAIGDFNEGIVPPAYRAVNRMLRPARFENYSSPYLRVPDFVDGDAATREWVTRFD